jgi:transcriptional regulator with XRE-family HTH domain
MVAFNELLKELRSKKGFTQQSLANAAGMSISAIAKLEAGGLDPSWSTVQKLAKALGVDCTAFQDKEAKGKRKGK